MQQFVQIMVREANGVVSYAAAAASCAAIASVALLSRRVWALEMEVRELRKRVAEVQAVEEEGAGSPSSASRFDFGRGDGESESAAR